MNRKNILYAAMVVLGTAMVLQGEALAERTFAEGRDACCWEPACCEDSSGRIFIRGEWLYWKPHVSGLELTCGTTFISNTIADGVEVINTEEFDSDPHYKWDSGYRIAAGYKFECSPWELDAFWTHFDGHGGRHSSEDANINNENHFHLKFNQIDVALAYNKCLGSSFIFKPFFGVRGLIVKEKVKARLVTDISPALTLSFATLTNTFDDHQKFSGAGPLIGFEGDWKMGCGLGIYGLASTSLVYANNKLHFDDTSIITAPYSQQQASINKRHVHSFNCSLDFVLGLSWQAYLCNTFQVITKLGFEHHQYFNLSQLGSNRGDLCFDGGTLALEFVY